jgi:hypothetical protein
LGKLVALNKITNLQAHLKVNLSHACSDELLNSNQKSLKIKKQLCYG